MDNDCIVALKYTTGYKAPLQPSIKKIFSGKSSTNRNKALANYWRRTAAWRRSTWRIWKIHPENDKNTG